MTWLVVAELIAKYGFPFAEKLIQNAQNNVPVTADEWSKLRGLIETPFESLVPKRPTP